MSVTQKQIAEKLGVSAQTVAYALNGHARVAPKTRQRIMEAAASLGYSDQSNSAARAMLARRYGRRVQTGMIGVAGAAFSDAANFAYWGKLVAGVQEGAQDSGHQIILLHGDLRGFAWEKVDGVLLSERSESETILRQLPEYLPRVALVGHLDGVVRVTCDDYRGGFDAAKHLLQLGHRRIGFLGHAEKPQIALRLAGYRDAMQNAGVAASARWIYSPEKPVAGSPAYTRSIGRETMQGWLANGWSDLDCTGLLVQNDLLALGAIEALEAAGVRVPDQVSVVGFDDAGEPAFSGGALTTLRVPLQEIGRRGVELLGRVQESDNETHEQNVVLPVSLQVRDSTAPVPAT